RLLAVAPGIDKMGAGGAAPPLCPWLIVQGDADDVVLPETVLRWARALEAAPGVRPAQLQVLHGAGHFFHGRINELRDVVLAFMEAADSPAA
ncbi:MAG: prolyl oligopeptidase family serine peptidase, partial [Steroidobacteraceae bacterium]